MTLMSALSSAVSGLRSTQAGIALVSQNVANADSAGYTKRRLQPVEQVAGDRSAGVRTGEIQRVLDRVLQRSLWQETSGAGYTGLRATMSGALERLYGPPGSASALDTLTNALSGAVDRLVDDPANPTTRSGVIEAGGTLAARIGNIANGVQALRTEAEGRIATMVDEANALLGGIERVNRTIVEGGSTAPLADERDRLVGELSRLMDIRVQPAADGSVTVSTGAGQALFDGVRALELRFDARSTLTPAMRADTSPPSVGVLSIMSPGGTPTDLLAAGGLRSGALAAAFEMRDETLVQAQRQLDELAAGLSRAFSDTGLTVTQTGGTTFDLSAFTEPLTVDLTVNGRFQRFSGTQAELDTALGAIGGGFAGSTVTVPAGGLVVSASSTNADPTLAGTGPFAFFTDAGNAPFTGVGTPDPITGFAQRIQVNGTVRNDPSLLVNGLAGDATRPAAMRDGLARAQTIASDAGLSGASPFRADLSSAVRRTIEVQGAAAASASRLDEGQRVALAAVEGRFANVSGVNVDEEMAQLVQLQTAYGANARVMSAVREMMDVLMRI
ncbi:flagellar hook-associated protein FlgK [Salinarimonas ramus]|uniref:Flagellar hook-associated protein 1 n=1 Tax=Salinarimonas ramus TaxID=690164 RepID=A0A917Q3P6_9HYPH|nr:flagellar hook-associated protein FlgK [Salinarimonas ramus]GGK19408.1 flagellar hook-associated protein FlgK [Salinarimonas ramus]